MGAFELILLKFFVATLVVLFLSFLAENVNPKWAGVLSGFPTGSAITLHFYAVENGLIFAGESALFNMIGLVAMQSFILCYYLTGISVTRYRLILSIFGGSLGYALAIITLSKVQVTPMIAVIIPLVSFPVFRIAFRKISHSKIEKKIKATWRVIMGRAILAAFTICIITAIAQWVGPSWAGLFSAFPTTLFPLLLIIHLNYGERHTYSIIKHVPDGLGSLLIYSFLIYLCYPSLALYSGIAIAFGGAILYLVAYRFISNYLNQRKS